MEDALTGATDAGDNGGRCFGSVLRGLCEEAGDGFAFVVCKGTEENRATAVGSVAGALFALRVCGVVAPILIRVHYVAPSMPCCKKRPSVYAGDKPAAGALGEALKIGAGGA